MQKLNFYFLLILIISHSFISCGDDIPTGSGNPMQPDTSTFTYPFTNGSSWNYSRTFTVSDFQPDSVRYHFPNNPVNASGTITISGDTVINGITAKIFIETYTEGSIVSMARNYYVNTDTALHQIAYRSGLTPVTILPKNKPSVLLKYNGKTYNRIAELMAYIADHSSAVIGDSLIIENPPVQVLKYPVVKNKEWVYRYLGSEIITNKYIDFVLLTIGGQNISCINTRMTWSTFDEITLNAYYSKLGRLKTNIHAENIKVTTPEYPDGIGTVDIDDISLVTSFSISNP